MSDRSVACPTCGVHRTKPLWPSVQTTPWTDECVCTDRELCIYHRFHCDEAPKRPSDEEMQARAEARHHSAAERWADERKEFRRVEQLQEEIADLKRVLRIVLNSNTLKLEAYQRQDGDDVSIVDLIEHHLTKHSSKE